MDDPWANAWGEPVNSTADTLASPKLKKANDNVDSEADISMPSWSTGPAVKWAEPTFGQGTLWGSSAEESPGKLWSTPSPYEGINLGSSLQNSLSRDKTPSPPPSPQADVAFPKSELSTSSQERIENDNSVVNSSSTQESSGGISAHAFHSNAEEKYTTITTTTPDASDQVDIPEENSPSPTRSRPPSLDLHPSAFTSEPFEDPYLKPESQPPEPSSPDGFGSFETGLDSAEAADDPWAVPITMVNEGPVTNTGSESWAAWGSETPNTADSVQTEDAWETAKRQKEMMDRHVPPHVLAGILQEFRAFSDELWPEDEVAPTGVPQGWQSGIEGVDNITEQVDRLAPKDMTISPLTPFMKTFTGRKLGETLKLTRNLPSTRSSPFNLYLVSKGSTAWETSVRSRIDASEDDILPAGWRVVEKEEPVKAIEDTSKRKSGFLSFFGRRTTEDTGPKKTAAAVAGSFSSAASPTTADPSRKSGDSNNNNSKPPTRPATPATSIPLTEPPNQSTLSPIDDASSQPPLSSSASEEFDNDVTPQPQSAVSRFLTRFSRPKGAHSRSPSQSMVLSTDDMDFLSEVVPSVSDDIEEFVQRKELDSMFNSQSVSSKLPPILPPPPRATTPTPFTYNTRPSMPTTMGTFDDPQDDLLSLGSGSRSRPTAPTPPSKSNPPSRQPSVSMASAVDDFSIFDMPVSNPSVVQTHPRPSSNSSSRSASPFTSPPQKSIAATSTARKAPAAIMSIGSQKSATSGILTPMLPPPPTSRTSSVNGGSTSGSLARNPSTGAAKATNATIALADDFSDFFTSPPRSTEPSTAQNTPHSASFNTPDSSFFSDFAEGSLVSKSSIKKQDSFDSFDSWTPTSGGLRTPSPPKVPAKPTSYGHKPFEPMRSATPPQIKPLQPMLSGGTPPRSMTSTPIHERTSSFTKAQTALGNNLSRPPSITSGTVPPPRSVNISRPSSTTPGILPPPPGGAPRIPLLDNFSLTSTSSPFSSSTGSRNSSPAPAPAANVQPLLSFDTPPNVNSQFQQPKVSILQAKPPALRSEKSQGPLSAQDLSFFEGL